MSGIIFKNISSTYLSRIWIGLISFLSVPYLIRKLGVDAYGVLSLSMIVIGYSALFDFGLARGVVKYIAEYNVLDNQKKLRKLIKSSLSIYTIIGLLGSVVLGVLTHFFLTRIFKIPVWLHQEALVVFYLTSFYLIFRLPQLLVQAITIGYQKIYLLNFLNTIFNSLKILLSVAAVSLGYYLEAVAIVNIVIGIIHFIVLYNFVEKFLPHGSIAFGYDKDTVSMVLRYSLKSFTADSLGMFITYIDKFIIGIFLPIASLAYYSVPFELTSRVWEFQVAAVATVFPTFSMYNSAGERDNFNGLYRKVTKFIIITAAFISSFLCVFATQILKYWISPEFAQHTSQILRIISWGVLTSSVLSIAGIILYSTSNLNRAIKVNAIMLIIHIILSLLLIKYLGMLGIALSWFLTHVIGMIILIPWINRSIVHFPAKEYAYGLVKPIGLALGTAIVSYYLFRGFITNLISLALIAVVHLLLYALLTYFFLLLPRERQLIKFFSSRIIHKFTFGAAS